MFPARFGLFSLRAESVNLESDLRVTQHTHTHMYPNMKDEQVHSKWRTYIEQLRVLISLFQGSNQKTNRDLPCTHDS